MVTDLEADGSKLLNKEDGIVIRSAPDEVNIEVAVISQKDALITSLVFNVRGVTKVRYDYMNLEGQEQVHI